MDAEGDVYDLLIILKKRGIDEEELIPSTKEHCIVEPMIIRKILPIIGFCIYTFFTIVLFLTRDGKIWMYLLLGVDRFTVALLQRCPIGMINWKYKTNFIRRFSKENADS